MQPGSSAQFRRSVFTFDPSRVLWEEGGHAWIPKHGTLEKARGMKGETRLLCRQSPFSANHSKSLFVLDPCSTPSPPHAHHPAAVIKHSFISLHPLVQFGHIIPCLSRGNLHKRPERTQSDLLCVQDTCGDPRRRGEICNAIKTYPSDIWTCGFWHFPLWFSGLQLRWDR